MADEGLTASQRTIADEMLRVHEESYGAGVAETAVHLVDDLCVVVLDVELTQAEQTLLDNGATIEVRRTREAFQEAIGPTFIAIVEHATGRKVTSFMSHMNIDPIYSVELFRLKPA